jgi:hypothetical protein
MAEQSHSTNWNAGAPQFGRPAQFGAPTPQAPFGMQALWRLAIWGCLATFALFVAAISAYSNVTSQRPTASITAAQKPSGQGPAGPSGQASSGQVASSQAASGEAAPASSGQGTPQPRSSAVELGARLDETAEETRRLAEAVRRLAADHDQVLARMTALERNLDGVTGSIKRDRIGGSQPTPPPSPSQAPPQTSSQAAAQNPPTAAAPAARPDVPAAPPPATEAAATPAQPPPAQQSATGDAAKTAMAEGGNRAPPASPQVRVTTVEPAEATAEPMVTAGGLGVDVGGATNYEGLRTLWHSTKNGDPAVLEELFPVVAIRENSKTHGVDLRLVLGPVADAEAAARLCVTLSAAHHYCQPVAFEGQRLALNDPAPTKTPPAPRRHPVSGSPGKFEPETPHFQAVIGK